MSDHTQAGVVLRDLGNGLVMRRAAPSDADALAEFNRFVHTGKDRPDELLAHWTRDLMSGRMPGFGPEDFTLVVDTKTGAIASTLNLISQTWRYEEIEFTVGRIELVGTHPDYRRRGLVRAQMDAVHQWSRERGEQVQAITGIPWYYRQFGYDLALEHYGGRSGSKWHVPGIKAEEKEPYVVRPAAEADIPFLVRVYDRGMGRYLVSAKRTPDMWRFDLFHRHEKSARYLKYCVIEAAGGGPVGILVHAPTLWWPAASALVYELDEGVQWQDVTPSVMRYLSRTAEEYAARDKRESTGAIGFTLGTDHPVYDLYKWRLPQVHKPYAWYMRVADVPAFLGHIRPVLERRLERSVLAGYTGDLHISFVGNGVKLAFQQGKVKDLSPWTPE
ncbi:MAG: GNAT family N-acetyltransferase [SAR202 cluster bacterium]|nr:GNAT family N-acetyltransferase [SAR202 cluster bacterium]